MPRPAPIAATAALAVAALGALAPAAAQAAPTTCAFDAAAATMTVRIAASGDEGAVLGRTPGGTLQVDGQPCGGATVFSTDRIDVVDLDDSQSFAFAHTLTLDLGNGRLGPGKTSEGEKVVSEIEIAAKLGGGLDRLQVAGSRSTATGDAIRVGSLGAALNADGDADLTFTGLDLVVLDGRAGNDVLSAAGGAGSGAPAGKTLVAYGGPGADTLTAGTRGAILRGDTQEGELAPGAAGADTLTGSPDADQLDGEGGNDVVSGGGSGDFIVNDAGDDRMAGGAGDDVFTERGTFGEPVAPNGADTIDGGDGEDHLSLEDRETALVVKLDGYANDGADTSAAPDGVAEEKDDYGPDIERIATGSGGDLISAGYAVAGERAQHFTGNGGNDTLKGGGGADTLWGGSDSDSIDGGTGDDAIDAAGEDDKVDGGDGDDAITGGFGDDVLYAGPGNDTFRTLWASDGGDRMSGGSGRDRAEYGDREAGVTVTLDNLADDGAQNEQDDVRSDVEEIHGGAGDDHLDADTSVANWNATAQRLDGNGGDDALEGGSGDDLVVGGPGDDDLIGGRGDDVLAGNAGTDAFTAADGFFDDIDGGDDADVLVSADPFDRRISVP